MPSWTYTPYDGPGGYWTAWVTPDWPITVMRQDGAWVGCIDDEGKRCTKPAATRAEAQRRTAKLAVERLERLAAKMRRLAKKSTRHVD